MAWFRKFNIYDLLIILLLIGVVLSNYIWLRIDQLPVQGHGLLGVIPSAQVYLNLRGMENTSKNYDQILGIYNWYLFYPPLSFLVMVLFYLLFGLQGQMVVMVNSIYIIVTLICVYLIGKNIFNRSTGLLAAFILSSFPGFIAFSREYWIEFGLMAYVVLDLYLLLKTNFFENRKYSIFLGITLALSFLHKPEFVSFVIGPLLLVVYSSGVLKDIFQAKGSNKATNIILTLILSLGIPSFWWLRYGKIFLQRIFLATIYEDNRISSNIPYLQRLLSNGSLTYYLRSLYFLLGAIFLISLFLSLTFMIIKVILKEKKRLYILCLILWFITPYITFTFISTKDTSHMLSLLPSLAILISAGIYFIKVRVFKTALIGLIVLYCLDLHLSSFYDSKTHGVINRLTFKWKFHHEGYYSGLTLMPNRERVEFVIEEVLKFIQADSYNNGEPVIIVVTEKGVLKNFVFEYYRMVGNYQFKIFFYNYPQDLSECDYIIVEDPHGESVKKIILGKFFGPDQERQGYLKLFKEELRGFSLIKKYNIPNGSASLLIYKRIADS